VVREAAASSAGAVLRRGVRSAVELDDLSASGETVPDAMSYPGPALQHETLLKTVLVPAV
jgi:hypothetical protein